MKKILKQIIATTFILLFAVILNAQSLQPIVLGALGGYSAPAGHASLSYNMGEALTATLQSDSAILTNGFEQPDIFTPGTITGIPNVCMGFSIDLTDTVPGGLWSSNNTAVAVVGSTGIVIGISAGTAIIFYTVLESSAIQTVTVNPIAAITGVTFVCTSSSITLSDAVSGGTWTSSNTGITIGSISGLVTAGISGTSTISYIMPTGCFATNRVTANSVAPPITGTNLCVGQGSLLIDPASGGTWASSNTAKATIGSAAGVITGIAAGTSIITYKLPGGCYATKNVTVNPLPSAITGVVSIVCQASVISLADPTLGGIWSSGNAAVATVGSGTGLILGVGGGTSIISYATLFGCTAIRTVTVNPISVISGPASVCMAQTITLTDTTAGGSWLSGNATIATIGSATGIVTGITGGFVTVTYIIAGTGCHTTYSFNVNRLGGITAPAKSLCVGQSLTLSDGVLGGTWASRDITLATVGSTSGIITGVSAGNVGISYILPTGCTTVSTFSVNPLAPIMGASSVCIDNMDTLTDAAGGGTWASDRSFWASIGSSTGIVTGISAGTVHISYTLSTGCKTGMPLVVSGCGREAPDATSFAETITLIPNPNTGEFTLHGTLASTNDEEVTIEITDMLGQRVYHAKITAKGGNIDERITLGNNLANGMYLLNLRAENENKMFHFVIGR